MCCNPEQAAHCDAVGLKSGASSLALRWSKGSLVLVKEVDDGNADWVEVAQVRVLWTGCCVKRR